jgi:hypothetical protein
VRVGQFDPSGCGACHAVDPSCSGSQGVLPVREAFGFSDRRLWRQGPGESSAAELRLSEGASSRRGPRIGLIDFEDIQRGSGRTSVEAKGPSTGGSGVGRAECLDAMVGGGSVSGAHVM